MEIWFGDNPFLFINNDKDVENLVSSLIDSTVVYGKKGGYPFLKSLEKALLTALVIYLYDYTDQKHQNFYNVMRLLRAGKADEDDSTARTVLDNIFKEISELDHDSSAVRYYNKFCRTHNKETQQLAIVSCIERLKSLGFPEKDDFPKENNPGETVVAECIEKIIAQKNMSGSWRECRPFQTKY